MSKYLKELFDDTCIVEKIKRRLPYLFQLAELESSRAGSIGMQVGSLRERVIIALFIYKFGEENVDTNIPITEKEIDVKLFGEPISIKTFTGKRTAGIKVSWTVEPTKSREFQENYYPCCDIILVQINWDDLGYLYYIPLSAQKRVFERIGRYKYIQLPKPGTNPRGIEFQKEALTSLLEDKDSRNIPINWIKSEISYNPYSRWVDLWKEDYYENQ